MFSHKKKKNAPGANKLKVPQATTKTKRQLKLQSASAPKKQKVTNQSKSTKYSINNDSKKNILNNDEDIHNIIFDHDYGSYGAKTTTKTNNFDFINCDFDDESHLSENYDATDDDFFAYEDDDAIIDNDNDGINESEIDVDVNDHVKVILNNENEDELKNNLETIIDAKNSDGKYNESICDLSKSINDMKSEIIDLKKIVITQGNLIENLIKCIDGTPKVRKIIKDEQFQPPKLPFKTIDNLKKLNAKLFDQEYLDQMVIKMFNIYLYTYFAFEVPNST